MKPKFVSGGTTLQFSKGLRYPLRKPVQLAQVTDRTAAGTLQVEDLGQATRSRFLTFTRLPLGDYQALVDFFENTAVGAMNTFTYYDEEGQDMTVRWLGSIYDFQQDRYQQFSGTIELEVVP